MTRSITLSVRELLLQKGAKEKRSGAGGKSEVGFSFCFCLVKKGKRTACLHAGESTPHSAPAKASCAGRRGALLEAALGKSSETVPGQRAELPGTGRGPRDVLAAALD